MVSEPQAPVPPARIVFSESDRAEILARIDASLQTGALTLGPTTRELEALFAQQHAVPYAVAVASGTAALDIALRSLDGIGRGVAGREVVVPADTFAATAFSVLSTGARPVFADVDPATLALSPATIEAALTPQTAAVVLVHIGGHISPQIEAIRALCDARDVVLVEDAAHAHGSHRGGTYAGSFGLAGSFSFYPTKVVTSGEGGMLVTSDTLLRDEALMYRDQGKAGFLGNLTVRSGYAWRMSELHAAVGLAHERRLPEFFARRQEVAARYTDGLRGAGGVRPLLPELDPGCNYYKYVALLDDGIDRDELKARCRERGVGLAGEVYERPLHLQPVFEPWARGPLPAAEDICARHICLPLHSDMTDAEAARVLEVVRTAVRDAPRKVAAR